VFDVANDLGIAAFSAQRGPFNHLGS
jgi:hypothetical protein